MRRTMLLAAAVTAVWPLSACGDADADPGPPSEVRAVCDSLQEQGPTIVEGLTGVAGSGELKDAVDALSAAVPDDRGELDSEAYSTFLLMNSDLVLISSELATEGRTLNTSLMDRMFDARDTCREQGVDVDL